jgi:hypothetical protein
MSRNITCHSLSLCNLVGAYAEVKAVAGRLADRKGDGVNSEKHQESAGEGVEDQRGVGSARRERLNQVPPASTS